MKDETIVYGGVIEDRNSDIMTSRDVFNEIINHYNKLKEKVLGVITNFVNPGEPIFIINHVNGEKWIDDEELDSYVIYPEECEVYIRTGKYTTDYYNADEIGKTIFSTKAEAEAKLKELKNER